jgi:deoxyhypusine synthase
MMCATDAGSKWRLRSCPGEDLRKKGLNRIGNLLVPNDNYCKFEDWVMPILDEILKEQEEQVRACIASHRWARL